jgi:tetratricopeptide (TPR) repeat protein
MNESELLALIAGTEGQNIDFKRELHLDTAKVKAELVKDIIAVANSESKKGYLIIGIDDDKQIVGTAGLEEERIQQIAYSHITPPVILTCELIPLATHGALFVGVITVKSTKQPHKVAVSIERLSQDEVFIRRGSITTKASPEDIIRMHEHEEETQSQREVKQYTRGAEIHLRLGNYLSAIAALSKAIEVSPTSELFIARAETYKKLQCANHSDDSWWSWGEAALKDLEDAIALSDSPDLETPARRIRRSFRGFAYANYTDEQGQQDFEHEMQSLEGIERAKWIFQEVRDWDPIFGADDYTVSLIQEAIGLGYQDPEVYCLLAEAHYGSHNYGLALKEIDRLIDTVDETNGGLIKFLCFRASTLAKMGRFKEARETLLRAKQLDEAEFSQWVTSTSSGEEFLCRYALDFEFVGETQEFMFTSVRHLILALGRTLEDLVTSVDGEKVIEWKTGLDYLEKKYPGILAIAREMVGEEYWKALKTGSPDIQVNLRFPAISELVQRMQEEKFSFVDDNKRRYLSFVSKK